MCSGGVVNGPTGPKRDAACAQTEARIRSACSIDFLYFFLAHAACGRVCPCTLSFHQHRHTFPVSVFSLSPHFTLCCAHLSCSSLLHAFPCISCSPPTTTPLRFTAVLDLSASTPKFSFDETNELRYLSHLYLPMVPGNDSAIKRYLADKLAQFQAGAGRRETN